MEKILRTLCVSVLCIGWQVMSNLWYHFGTTQIKELLWRMCV